jgi:hypothetical protein
MSDVGVVPPSSLSSKGTGCDGGGGDGVRDGADVDDVESSVARNRRLQILGRAAEVGDELVPSMACARDSDYPEKAHHGITRERMCEERIKKDDILCTP